MEVTCKMERALNPRLDVIISTSIFKCIFFVAFKVGKQRNVEIDYDKCTKGKALINKKGRMTNGGKFESAIKKGDCSFESQFRFGWRKLNQMARSSS
jgi:hypothetical protein